MGLGCGYTAGAASGAYDFMFHRIRPVDSSHLQRLCMRLKRPHNRIIIQAIGYTAADTIHFLQICEG